MNPFVGNIQFTMSLEGEPRHEDIEELFAMERIIRRRITSLIRDSFTNDWPLRGEHTCVVLGAVIRMCWISPDRHSETLAQFRAVLHSACDKVTRLAIHGDEIVLTDEIKRPRLAA